MPAVVIHESRCDIGLEVGQSPQVLFVVKTDSQVTLTQLRNESVTTRSRPFANKFNYARDMCHGTSIHPTSVKAIFEPGRSQNADGLTKVLAGASMKTFVSDLGLAPLTRRCVILCLKPPNGGGVVERTDSYWGSSEDLSLQFLHGPHDGEHLVAA